jgi:Oxidoreductase family, NAD-binding Rossmann fold/Oxidoreductase family, C-terminal alpha/beta domain
MGSAPVTAVIIGNGHRADLYASYALEHSDELSIVGVADPDEFRREAARKKFGFPAENCFASAAEFAARERFADAVINGTMDQQHVPTSIPILEAGYDMLLEKPFAVNEAEMWELVECARKGGNKVMICHVLRYAPFYAGIRKRVAAGEIGEIINAQFTEHVSYHHVVIGYVRGKWRRADQCGCGMLMAKSCHDLDLVSWMKSGVKPVRVASYGSNFQFRPEKAPPGAGERCLVDCTIEADCLYSARKHYLDHPKRWAFYVWSDLEGGSEPTIEEKEAFLKSDSIWGRCAWKCDNDAVDHQTVAVDFEDGSTVTLNMIGGCAKAERSVHLIGTRGEIQGSIGDERFVVRHIETRPGQPEYTEEVVDLNVVGDTTGAFGGHGGGDMRLVADFVSFMRGEERSISCTDIDDSVAGHLMGFCAEQAREEARGVEVNWR